MPSEPNRREQLADAAIEIIAREGARALTLDAVDAEADVAAGTTAEHYPTRQALLEAVAYRLLGYHWAETRKILGDRPLPVGSQEIAQITAELVNHGARQERSRSLARFELVLEAARCPELRKIMARIRDSTTQTLFEVLTQAGAPRHEQKLRILAAAIGGMLLDQLTLSEDGAPWLTGLDSVVYRMIEGVFGPSTRGGMADSAR